MDSEAIVLAWVVDEGKAFQKIGDEFTKITMADIKPYNESVGNMESGKSYDGVSIGSEAYEALNDKTIDFRTWALKVVNLGLTAPNMDLYILEDDGKHYPIKFIPD